MVQDPWSAAHSALGPGTVTPAAHGKAGALERALIAYGWTEFWGFFKLHED